MSGAAGPDVWPLYRNGDPYTLIVYGPTPDGTWEVEIHEDHVSPETRSSLSHLGDHILDRDSHIVGDMWEAVAEAMDRRAAEREDFSRSPWDPPEWMRDTLESIGGAG